MRAPRSVVSCGCVRTFLRLLGFLRPYRRGATLSVVLAGIAMVGTAAVPWLIGRAIDQIQAGDRAGLNLVCLGLVGAGLLRLVFSVARRVISGRVSLALAPVPFVVAVAARYGRRSRPALQEVQQRIAELTAEAEENVSGVRVVKAFAAEPRQLERFRTAVRRVFDQAMYSTRLSAFYQPFIGFLPQLGLAAILIVGGRQVIDGTLTAGDFAAFYTYLLMLISPMRSLGIALGFAQRATASGVRLFQILDRAPRLQSPPDAQPLPAGNGRVALIGVSFAYEDGPPVLRDIDL